MRSPAVNVGILDDEPRFRQALGRLLRTYGFKVRTFERGHDLFTALNEESLDCLLLDLHMPVMTGFDVLRQLRTRSAPPPVIVITGHDEPGNLERVAALSAVDYLLKPVDETVLLKSIERCLVPGSNTDSSGGGQITKTRS
jgi:two-component system, LuxR family, response regulator FixJ